MPFVAGFCSLLYCFYGLVGVALLFLHLKSGISENFKFGGATYFLNFFIFKKPPYKGRLFICIVKILS